MTFKPLRPLPRKTKQIRPGKPIVTHVCDYCGDEYKTIYEKSKYCSKSCQNNYNKHKFRKDQTVSDDNISRSTVGAISELRVCYDLMRRGYDVFRAMSPNSHADVIAIKAGNIYQLEVRTGRYLFSGKVWWPSHRSSNKSIVVYTFKDDKIHYITNPELVK